MDKITYALIHSPLIGPLTWQLVQREMAVLGCGVITPALTDEAGSTLPYWQQHAESAAKGLFRVPLDRSLVLVGHSGAGALLPAIRQALTHQVYAYVFVDAGIPRNNLSRLDMMRLQNQTWADQFLKSLLSGERFPNWKEEDLRDAIPIEELRVRMVSEINPRSLDFYNEPIPVFSSWPDAPCAFIKLSATYEWDFQLAKKMGWVVRDLDEGHFHMLVDPKAVSSLIIGAVQEIGHKPQ